MARLPSRCRASAGHLTLHRCASSSFLLPPCDLSAEASGGKSHLANRILLYGFRCHLEAMRYSDRLWRFLKSPPPPIEMAPVDTTAHIQTEWTLVLLRSFLECENRKLSVIDAAVSP